MRLESLQSPIRFALRCETPLIAILLQSPGLQLEVGHDSLESAEAQDAVITS